MKVLGYPNLYGPLNDIFSGQKVSIPGPDRIRAVQCVDPWVMVTKVILFYENMFTKKG